MVHPPSMEDLRRWCSQGEAASWRVRDVQGMLYAMRACEVCGWEFRVCVQTDVHRRRSKELAGGRIHSNHIISLNSRTYECSTFTELPRSRWCIEDGARSWCVVRCQRRLYVYDMSHAIRFCANDWCIKDEARSLRVVIHIQIIPYHSTLARTNVQLLQSFRDQGCAWKRKQGVGVLCVLSACCMYATCCVGCLHQRLRVYSLHFRL